MTGQKLPTAVIAAITAALAEELSTTPDRLRLRMVGLTSPENADDGWRMAARMAAMRPVRFPRG